MIRPRTVQSIISRRSRKNRYHRISVDIPNGLLTSKWGTDKAVKLCRRLGKTEVALKYGCRSASERWEGLQDVTLD